MSTATIPADFAPSTAGVTLNADQRLYVIKFDGGYSCLGFGVARDRATRIANLIGREVAEAIAAIPDASLDLYGAVQWLEREAVRLGGKVAECYLSPQLRGLEGRWVQVVDRPGAEPRRFRVGRSTGPLKIHLEVESDRATGGGAARDWYETVQVVA